MSNRKHVQLKPEDAAKIVEVLADVEKTEERGSARSRAVRKGG